MKTKIILLSILTVSLIAFAFKNSLNENGKEPWTKEQLMEPADLAKIINNPTSKKPIIYSVGPSGLIKNSIDIGEGKDKNNLNKLKTEVSKLPKDASIIIYCGCCPFGDCPNIRPTFSLLNEMNFTNHKLLNLPKNLKVDWIDKEYPMNE